MKKLLICFISICTTFSSYAQWSTSGGLSSSTNTTGGNVGIGTSSPNSMLDIKYDGTAFKNIYRATDQSGQFRWRIDQGFDMYLTNSSGSDIVKIGQNGSWFNSGNVGIGTSNPSMNLDITTNGDYQGIQLHHTSGRWTTFFSSLPIYSYNGITGANDSGIIFGNDSGTVNNGFVIAPHQGATSGLRVDQNGNVGIGTFGPSAKLHINGQVKIDGSNEIELGAGITKEVSAGKIAYMKFSDALDIVGAGTTGSNRKIRFYNEGGAFFNGNVGIGTSSPDQLLSVNGTIHSKEVKVDLSVPAPDYVFEKDYNLFSLDSIKTFIAQNKHLPEVPSAKEMEANGVNLGLMNMLLLRKMEEMTLHLIKQNEVINELRTEVRELKGNVTHQKKSMP